MSVTQQFCEEISTYTRTNNDTVQNNSISSCSGTTKNQPISDSTVTTTTTERTDPYELGGIVGCAIAFEVCTSKSRNSYKGHERWCFITRKLKCSRSIEL
jgi:hypothetical protein